MYEMSAPSDRPSVVLVHGAFADASSWGEVTRRLETAGVPVRAIVNPLRGIREDAAYVSSAIDQMPGPVLAVGHSYGGAVITNAAASTKNVRGLVYVAAFAPDEGEAVADIESRSKDSALLTAVQEGKYPIGDMGETATEYWVDPDKFHEVFAADLPKPESDVLAVSQRPASAATLSEQTLNPAWKSMPSWAVVATKDRAAGSDVVRSMAQRAGADITEVDGSHVVMISQPDAVTEVILKALKTIK